ncbi:MAG: S8 family serine peptidase [Tolypothrix brevis GSE-NOS-MK-07-07A]|jgi:subtilisin family serine protease|nr:S8 family serine peptidase [Tolypothrix brevis GSE-NOS-MK-07-07A]
MASLSVLLDCVSSFERDFKSQYHKIQSYLEPSERKSLNKQVELDKVKKIELIGELRNGIIPEINDFDPLIENISDIEETVEKIIEETVEKIKKVEQFISQGKQKDLVREIGTLLKSDIESVETLSNTIDFSNNEQIISELHDLRNKGERIWRLTLLITPADEKEFQAAIMWAAEQGQEIELDKLQKLKGNLPYNSSQIQQLLKYSQKRIEERLWQKEGKYRVLCSKNELERFENVRIVKSYPAFTIISASMLAINNIKPFFPVERLKFYERPNPSPGYSNMRDQVVRFKNPVLESWKQKIEEIGAKILQPLSRLEIVVSVSSEDIINQLRSFEEVSQVTPYVPKIRVQPQYLQNLGQSATKEAIATARLKAAENPPSSQNRGIPLPGILIANFFTQEDRDLAAQDLESQGIRVADQPRTTKLVLDLSSDNNAIDSLKIIANQIGLKSLEEKVIPKLFNEEARHIIGKGVIPSNPMPTLGLTGKGEIIAIADTGLDTGESETLHLDFRDRVRWINSYPIQSSLNSYILNPGSDDGASDTYSGHGTHVAGTALGNGEQAKKLGISSIPAGMATDAQLIFQAIEQTPKWNLQGQLLWLNSYHQNPPKSGLFGIPDDLKQLFEDAYEKGARIHSNSWGGGEPGGYDDRCNDLDLFVWEHKNFLVLVAAGNDGKHRSSGTPAIEQGSVSSPGTAKNCLTVGASENNRNGQFSDAYGNWWPNDFPHLPFKSDGMVDSVDDIAAFSSRGPCQNGRRHPDVIAPGTFILSTRSSQIASNNFAWGAYPSAKEHYMYMGGTSMATPMVAGCAALVRQYLREKHQPSIIDPSAALIKAALIHSATYIDYRFAHPSSNPWADNEQGWGRIKLQQVLNPAEPTQVLFIDEANGLKTGEKAEYRLQISDSKVPLKVTLVYTDYPGEDLINNLNLILYRPNSTYILGNDFEGEGIPDTVNNVEGIIVETPEIGEWRIEVIAEVQQEQQDYALVISAGGLVRI